MNRVFTLLLLVALAVTGQSENKWDSKLIADSLKKDARAVIRLWSTEYERTSVESFTENVHLVVTVMNERGEAAANLVISYDRNSKVGPVEGKQYDKDGALTYEIKKKDLSDYAYNNNFTLFSDNRVKVYSPSGNSYPYTIEYRYSVEHKGVAGFGTWAPQLTYHVSAEEAQLRFRTPMQLALRYKELNYPFKATVSEAGNMKQYQWTVKGLPAIVKEPYGPHYLDVFPAVLLSPNEIVYEGFAGDFSTWKSYGKWSSDLNAGRQVLSPATVEEVRRIVQPITDRKEQIKALYRYMQRKTRYVNITLGIGGWQPFPATEVDEKGYGDCKGLSNYMKALLKSAGIESLYTIIGSGPGVKIKFPDFPGNGQANHIILCVPLEQDSVWLECTSQTIPFGYIGTASAGRHCVLISPEGGILARTPDCPAEKNIRSSSVRTTLMENGSASFESVSRFRNHLFEEVSSLISQSKDQQKKALLTELSAGGLTISDFSLADLSGDEADASLSVKGTINSYSVRAGGRLFVQPNFLFKNSFPDKIGKDRKYALCQETGFWYRDTLNLTLPDQFTLEFLPQNFSLSSVYGNFEMTYAKVDENQVMVVRSVRINKGEYDRSKFAEIGVFLMNVAKREKEKLVLAAKI